MKEVSCLIVGGGPVGIYLAGKLEEAHMDYLLLEAHKVGGQVLTLYPEKPVEDVPEIGNMKAKDVFENLLKKVDGAKIIEDTKVLEIKGHEVHTDKGVYLAKSIVLCTGLGRYVPRKLEVPGEEGCRNIHYALLEPTRLYGKKVAIFGGGDSALDWAKALSGHSEVHLIHRRREFRGDPSTIEGCDIALHLPYIPVSVEQVEEEAKSVTIENVETKERERIEIDEILVNYGALPEGGHLGFPKDERGVGLKVDDHFMVAEGIYACGDCIYHPDHKKRMAPGFRQADKVLESLLSTY